MKFTDEGFDPVYAMLTCFSVVFFFQASCGKRPLGVRSMFVIEFIDRYIFFFLRGSTNFSLDIPVVAPRGPENDDGRFKQIG